MYTIDEAMLNDIPDLLRVEKTSPPDAVLECKKLTKSSYSHEELFHQFCTIQEYIDVPPGDLFNYMKNTLCLAEWTYSMRQFKTTEEPGLYESLDMLGGGDTKIFTRTVANDKALTVDYHCAWDQGQELWMIYLMRIIPAEVVLKKPGSVLVWTNCRHPYYDKNPYPETVPNPNRPWVGAFFNLFYGAHLIELKNLKAIAEYRYKNGIPLGPHVK